METVTINIKDPVSNLMSELDTMMSGLKHDPFRTIRKESKDLFEKNGFPTTKHEEWKYTNVIPAVSKSLLLAPKKDTDSKLLNGLNTSNGIVVAVVNGYVTIPSSLPEGLIIKNIADSVNDPFFAKHFDKYTDKNVDSFTALNGSFLNEGLYIEVLPGKKIDQPVYILNYTVSVNDEISHPRMLIVSRKSSEAVVEFVTVSSGKAVSSSLMNAVVEIAVEENARLDFCILQNDGDTASQICNTYTYQEQNSHLNVNTITMGGALVKNKLHLMLDGQNIETHLFGLYMGSNKQHIDNHTAVFHAKPHCFSNQLYKGILDDESQGVFNGKIFVMQDAQKTNAFQSNKNILLSDNAAVYAKPQLEIFADDVKCSHGATTGQLDDEALFYLRSRGIGEENAKALLNVAFAADVIKNIPNENLREYILNLIQTKLIKE